MVEIPCRALHLHGVPTTHLRLESTCVLLTGAFNCSFTPNFNLFFFPVLKDRGSGLFAPAVKIVALLSSDLANKTT